MTGPLAGLRESYDAAAQVWDGGATYARLAEALVAASPVSVAGSRVLDLGAGTGVATRALTDGGAEEVVAIDLAEGMLRAGPDGHSRRRVYRRAEANACALFCDGWMDR